MSGMIPSASPSMKRLSCLVAPWTPGVSTKTICPRSLLKTPVIRLRVVCGLGVTMASFSPTIRLSSVDLPTLGRPKMATVPATVPGGLDGAPLRLSLCRPFRRGRSSWGLLYNADVVLSRDMRVFSALAVLAFVCPPRPRLWPKRRRPPAAGGLRLNPAPDGALEIRSGDDVVTRLPLKTPALRRGTPALREVTVEGHRLAELRVPVRGTSAEEVWIGEVAGRPARSTRIVWSGMTGARDADGESFLWVEATPERVVEYQTAAGIDRCDGIPPRLFPRAYDFASGRFRPIVSSLPPAGSETLVGHRGDPAMPAGRPIADFHFVAASTTRGAGSDARGLTAPLELDDGNPATSWAEGLGGDGRGEFLTARAAATGYPIRGLRILPGDGASLQAFHAKNRVSRLQIALGPAPEQRFDVELPDDPAGDAAHWRDAYWVPLPKPMTSSCVTVVITGVTPGSEAAPPKNYGTTAIGELAIFTDADGPDGANRLVSDLASAPDCAARLPLVVALGEAAVLPTAQAVLAASGPARECLVEALTTLAPAPKNPIVVEALAAAVTGASEKEEKLVTTALGRAAVPPVAALSGAAGLAFGRGRGSGAGGAHPGRVRRRRRGGGAAGGRRRRAAGLAGAIVQAASGAHRVHAEAVLAAFAAAPHKRRQGGGAGRRPGAHPAGGGQADAGAPGRRRRGPPRGPRRRPPVRAAWRAPWWRWGHSGPRGMRAWRRSPPRRPSPTIPSCATWPRASSAISRTPARPPTRGPCCAPRSTIRIPASARPPRSVWRNRGTPRRAARSSPAPSRSPGRSCGAPSCRRWGGCAWRAGPTS